MVTVAPSSGFLFSMMENLLWFFRSAQATFNTLFSSQENLNNDQLTENWLEVYQSSADRLSSNLRSCVIYILTFSQFYFKTNRNQLEIVVRPTSSIYPNGYFEILYLTFWEISLVKFKFPRRGWDQRLADFYRFSQ